MFSSTAPLETPDLRPGAPEKDGELMKPQLPVKLPETLKLQEMLGKSMVNTWKHVINGHIKLINPPITLIMKSML